MTNAGDRLPNETDYSCYEFVAPNTPYVHWYLFVWYKGSREIRQINHKHLWILLHYVYMVIMYYSNLYL